MKLSIFIILLLSLTNVKPNIHQYDEHIAEELSAYSLAAYCSHKYVLNWNCGKMCNEHPQLIDITEIYESQGNSSGFIAFNYMKNQIVLVFRGTQVVSIQNILTDLKAYFQEYEHCTGCKMHSGIYQAFKVVKRQVFQQLEIYQKKYPSALLMITGHSLGGALATLTASELTSMGYSKLVIYTFGSPRIGNYIWVNWFMNKFEGIHYRITNRRDPVPHLAPSTLSHSLNISLSEYEHVPTEVFYSGIIFKDYDICDSQNGEDSKCANKYKVFNILDHMSYVGYNYAIQATCQF